MKISKNNSAQLAGSKSIIWTLEKCVKHVHVFECFFVDFEQVNFSWELKLNNYFIQVKMSFIINDQDLPLNIKN